MPRGASEQCRAVGWLPPLTVTAAPTIHVPTSSLSISASLSSCSDGSSDSSAIVPAGAKAGAALPTGVAGGGG